MSEIKMVEKNSTLDALLRSLKGYGANACAITLTQPLEVLRIQSQVTHTPFRQLASNIIKKDGMWGFYRGLGASLVTQPVYWSIFFPIYYHLNSSMNSSINSSMNSFVISNIAGTIGVIATNPLWVLRTRLQAETVIAEKDRKRIRYRDFFSKIIRNEGFASLYKGTPITLVKNLQMGIQMPLYEALKREYNPVVAGAAAKLVSSTIVYPMDTIRTNIRTHRGAITYRNVITEIYNRPGKLTNFYRGIGIYWMTQVPVFAITMGVFEKLI